MHKATGGGYEDYPNTVVSFLDVDNIHVMHESLDKLKKVHSTLRYATRCCAWLDRLTHWGTRRLWRERSRTRRSWTGSTEPAGCCQPSTTWCDTWPFIPVRRSSTAGTLAAASPFPCSANLARYLHSPHSRSLDRSLFSSLFFSSPNSLAMAGTAQASFAPWYVTGLRMLLGE